MADALADSGIERLTNVNWQATDRWGDTPLQVCGIMSTVCERGLLRNCQPGGQHALWIADDTAGLSDCATIAESYVVHILFA
jgi:hypothetical protein